jgi:hypothetical protein
VLDADNGVGREAEQEAAALARPGHKVGHRDLGAGYSERGR